MHLALSDIVFSLLAICNGGPIWLLRRPHCAIEAAIVAFQLPVSLGK
jgi:hypothetical protein